MGNHISCCKKFKKKFNPNMRLGIIEEITEDATGSAINNGASARLIRGSANVRDPKVYHENSNFADDENGSKKENPDILSLAMDRLGMDKELNKDQIWSYERMEFISTFCYRSWDFEERVYYGGSQIEGTTIPELHSDLDILYPIRALKVSEDCSNEKNVIGNLYQLVNDKDHPGFVKIKLFNQQTLSFVKADDGFEPYVYQAFHVKDPSDGTLLLSNDRYKQGHNNIPGRYQHGPAFATDATPIVLANDFVPCLKLNFWPSVADDWLNRPYNYPTSDIIRYAHSKECFVVPIGSLNPDGSRNSVNWRLSFTLQERILIWSWNIAQRKLYVLLKILVKEILQVKFPDIFCSYHMKTLLFWMFEITDEEFWQEDRLSACFELCIGRLTESVAACSLPQYFIPENNLFEKLSNHSDKEEIIDFMFRLKTEGWHLIRRCKYVEDAIAASVLVIMSHIPEGKRMITVDQAFEIANHNFNILQTFAEVRFQMLFRFLEIGDLDRTISNHEEHLGGDILKLMSYTDDDMKLLLHAHNMVKSSLGSHLLARVMNKLKDKEESIERMVQSKGNLIGDITAHVKDPSIKDLLTKAEEYLTIASRTDATAGQMKLAGFYYTLKNYDKVFSLVAEITANALIRGQIIYLCGEQDVPSVQNEHFLSYLFRHKPTVTEQLTEWAAMEIIYMPTESICAPGAIKLEMNRVLSWFPIQNKDRWLHWAIIDPFVFAYYLEFLCYHEMGDTLRRGYSLKRLENEVVEEIPIAHRDTGYNLLGHCYMVLGSYAGAIAAFACSLAENPIHNVAHWMLLVLLYELYRDFKLPIFKMCLPACV